MVWNEGYQPNHFSRYNTAHNCSLGEKPPHNISSTDHSYGKPGPSTYSSNHRFLSQATDIALFALLINISVTMNCTSKDPKVSMP